MSALPSHANPLWPDAHATETCASCVWRYQGGRGRPVDRCRRHASARVSPDWPACSAWEGTLDCLTCGACCREAYHAVEVSRRDPFVRAHPELVVRSEGRLNVRRERVEAGQDAASKFSGSERSFPGRPRSESVRSETGNAGRKPQTSRPTVEDPASGSGTRCACLMGGPGDWHCVVYADRPRTCRDFERGGPNCVDARRRVGLTR